MHGFKRAAFGTLFALAIAACGRPDFNTDLNTEGAPSVVIVAVASESLGEVATFCKSGLAGDKTNANYCPEEDADQVGPIGDAVPIGFYVRIAFDELLDPSIETIDTDNGVGELVAAAGTVECGGNAVAVSGFYDPSGSHLTFPAGPAIVFESMGLESTDTGTVATSSDCEVTIGDVVKDKDGNSVDSGERGPYDFSIAPLSAAGTEPQTVVEGDPLPVVPVDIAILVQFNNFIDAATLAGEVTLHDDTLDADVPIDVVVNAEDATQVAISATAGVLDTSTDYTVTISGTISGGTVADVEGGLLDADVTFSFTTTAVGLPDAGAPDA